MAKRTNSKFTHPRNATRLTRIEYVNPQATSVYIAGQFNDWHPTITEMFNIGNGRWAKDLTLTPGTYEYRLVVDGQWMEDPACHNCAPNPFGGRNSVLTVPA
ncbi:MAG: glycoside hydrolase family 13 [Verrucomicrobia bacterium]|nr:glycoside hydrolase family 13 [Verrucomicrobiota bacterium]